MKITDDMKLIDVNGAKHEFKRSHVYMMLNVGWSFFFIAWILNIIYYKLHPSAVDFRFARVKEKFQEYKRLVFGNGNGSKSSGDNEKTRKRTPEENKKTGDIELRPFLENEQLITVVPNHHHIVHIENVYLQNSVAEDNHAVKVLLETHF